MRRAAAILLACLGGLVAGEAQPSAEATVTGWIQALRAGDLGALWAQLPEAQRSRAEAQWKAQVAGAGAQGVQQADRLIAMLDSPQAVDGVMAVIAPALVQIDTGRLAKQIGEVAGFIGAASAQPQPEGQGVDLPAVKEWLLDVAAWLPRSGINEVQKARQFSERLVNAFRATGIHGSHELTQLGIGDLLARLKPGLPELKAGLALYDLQADALFASLAVARAPAGKDEGAGDTVRLMLSYSAFGKAHSAPLVLVNKGGAWQFGEGKDSPLAGVMQLVVMAMMMNAFNAPPAAAPAPATGGPL